MNGAGKLPVPGHPDYLPAMRVYLVDLSALAGQIGIDEACRCFDLIPTTWLRVAVEHVYKGRPLQLTGGVI
jgi:hypothetical protein